MQKEPMEFDFEDEESGLSLLEYMPTVVLLEIFKFLDWNDICQVTCTCTKFRDVCQSATLWLQLKELDFRSCAVPDPEKILAVLRRTPNAEYLILGDVLTDEASNENEDLEESQEQDHNLSASDQFLLNSLKLCQKIAHLDLHMEKISDMSVDAVCAKCTELRILEIHDNHKIQTEAICELLSLNQVVTEIVIDSCDNIRFPEIKHKDPEKQLMLKKLSLQHQMIVTDNVHTVLKSCPNLIYLDLTASDCLNSFNIEITQGQRCGLDSLEVLILQGCKEVQTLEIPYCPNLKVLDMSYCGQLTDITATTPRLKQLHVQGCEKLQKINLVSSDITEQQCQDLEHLERLHLGSSCLCKLDILNCSRLNTQQLLATLTDKSCLTWLNITGCKSIPPTDVNDVLLPELSGLHTLLYGGHSWNTVRLKSGALTQFEFANCINTTCVLLDLPSLEDLTLSNCRDFSEQELVDSFLHGQLLTRMQGLENLKTSHTLHPVFESGGVSSLRTLRCHKLPGIHGDIMSHGLSQVPHLTCVEFVHCTFLEHLSVIGWPSLQSLKVESCNRLQQLAVRGVNSLHTLHVKWCSMVEKFHVESDNLCQLEVTGTNFASVHISCDRVKTLHLNGVCTLPTHSMHIRCLDLRELSITKCDRLTDGTVRELLTNNPNIKAFTLLGSLSLSNLTMPSGILECSLTGHRILKQVDFDLPINVQSLSLNHLPKFSPEKRKLLLEQCKATLKSLEVRAIAGETTLTLNLPELQSLTLYQGLQLISLGINCPRLKYLRIQGCPKLSDLTLHTQSITQVQVYHSPPLLALRSLQLFSKKVNHLARVLAHYCPGLTELCLFNSEVKGTQLYNLGSALPKLTKVTFCCCSLMDIDIPGESLMVSGVSLGRVNGPDLHVYIVNKKADSS